MTKELIDARAAIRAMVKEIGSEPMQDIHHDAWFYPDQSPQLFGLQPYEHSVIRQYVAMVGGKTGSALVAMADYLMVDIEKTATPV
jgi:hypothetical protein